MTLVGIPYVCAPRLPNMGARNQREWRGDHVLPWDGNAGGCASSAHPRFAWAIQGPTLDFGSSPFDSARLLSAPHSGQCPRSAATVTARETDMQARGRSLPLTPSRTAVAPLVARHAPILSELCRCAKCAEASILPEWRMSRSAVWFRRIGLGGASETAGNAGKERGQAVRDLAANGGDVGRDGVVAGMSGTPRREASAGFSRHLSA